MSGSRARWVLLAGVLAPLLAATARADEAGPVAAAWIPSGVGVVAAPTQPEGSLHVGAALGQETDRTYLRFAVPADAEDLTLAIPVDPDAGTSAPETAAILACAVPEGFDPDATEAAAVDCEGAPTVTFGAGVLTVALPASGDVALVPTGDGTWHVGFDSDAPRVTYDVPAPPTTTTTTMGVASSPSVGPPTGSSGIALPDLSPPPVAAGQAIADQAAAPPAAVTVVPANGPARFRYGAVFGLPLVLLVVVGLAGDGLTRPVRLREDAA